MLKQRILTALVLLPLMLMMLLWTNQAVWGIFCGVIALMALWEYGRIVGFCSKVRSQYLMGTAFFLLMAWAGDWMLPSFVWLMVLVFWLLIMPMWLKRKWSPVGIWKMVCGWLLMLPFWFGMMLLRPESESVATLLSLMVLVWIADSGAYFVGRAIGKHKMAPVISPKKSWEGAIGGWVMVLIYMCWIQTFGWMEIQMGWFGLLLLTTVLVWVSIGGDLLESWLKRVGGVKDSSHILPGHGGVFDRIDSLIAVVSVYSAMLVLFYS